VLTRTLVPVSREELQGRLRKIIAAELGVEPEEVQPETEIPKIRGADSIRQLEATMAIEDEFDLEIPDAILDQLQTLDDLTRYVAARLGISETSNDDASPL
jgi:acyl carrier protein